MADTLNSSRLKGHRFPREILAEAVRLYLRFNLSLRDVEELPAERGMVVSYETIRKWVARFAPQFAAAIRPDRPQPRDKWHLDEMVIRTRGEFHWLWRAVDADGEVLDILVQSRRTAWTAELSTAARAILARRVAATTGDRETAAARSIERTPA